MIEILMLFGWPRLALLSFLFTPASLTVTGCGSDGPGAIWVDPSKYTFYRCDDLAQCWKVLIAREDELRGLMEKANESAAGAVIGSVAYRSDYEAVLSEEKCCSAQQRTRNAACR